MFSLFKGSPLKKWRKQYEILSTRAFQAQRNGDIRLLRGGDPFSALSLQQVGNQYLALVGVVVKLVPVPLVYLKGPWNQIGRAHQ